MTEAVRNVKGEVVSLMRQHTAESLNALMNHPDIYEDVRGPLEGVIDLSGVVENQCNILLAAQHGCVLFGLLQPGLYDAHIIVLRQGRGRWALALLRSALHWVFTRTDAVEVVCRVPAGNLAARAIAMAVGGEPEFAVPRGWMYRGSVVPVTVLSLSVQKWLRTAPGLVDRGRWLSRRIKRAMEREGMPGVSFIENKVQDRYAGAAVDMLLGGQPGKAVALYNRWATVAGGSPIRLVAARPPTIDLGQVLLIFRGEDVVVIPCPQQS